jgi:hypothetical protein
MATSLGSAKALKRKALSVAPNEIFLAVPFGDLFQDGDRLFVSELFPGHQ